MPGGMKIGEKTRAKVLEQIENLLKTYQDKIEAAYCLSVEPFAVAIAVKFHAAGRSGTKVTTKLSFVESKITDGLSEVVDEQQMELFDDSNVESIAVARSGGKPVYLKGGAK